MDLPKIMIGTDIKKMMANATAIQVYGNAKHRHAITDPVRVVINQKYRDEDVEPEILVVTKTMVFRIIPDKTEGFVVRYSKIGEVFDEFGQCLIERTEVFSKEKPW